MLEVNYYRSSKQADNIIKWLSACIILLSAILRSSATCLRCAAASCQSEEGYSKKSHSKQNLEAGSVFTLASHLEDGCRVTLLSKGQILRPLLRLKDRPPDASLVQEIRSDSLLLHSCISWKGLFLVKILAKLPVFDTSLCTFSRQLAMVSPQFFDRVFLSCNNGFSQTAFWQRPIASRNRPSVSEHASLRLSSEAVWAESKVILHTTGAYCQERWQPFCWTKDFSVKLISHPVSSVHDVFFMYQKHGLTVASWQTSNSTSAFIASYFLSPELHDILAAMLYANW